MKKKVGISVYLVSGGIGLFFIGLIFMGLYSQSICDFFHHLFKAFVGEGLWLLMVSLYVVLAGTIWGFVDWMRTIAHKRKSQTDPAYADQTEPPPAHGIIAFWVGFIFIVGCAIIFAILFAIALSSMTH